MSLVSCHRITHNNAYYLFIMFRHQGLEQAPDRGPESKILQTAKGKLPENLGEQILSTEYCPKLECYFGTKKPLTFNQEFAPLEGKRMCRALEAKTCKDKKEVVTTKGKFQVTWNPYVPPLSSTELEEIPDTYIAYLIHLKTFDIVATSMGTMHKIESVEVHPRYRGLGICHVFFQWIVHTLKEWKVSSFTLTNAAGEAGTKCYIPAAKQNGYHFECRDKEQIPGSCREMTFRG